MAQLPSAFSCHAASSSCTLPPVFCTFNVKVPGLRAGHYLCYFGMHVLTPSIFALLDDAIGRHDGETGQTQLTPALDALARGETYLALEAKGTRHNLGVKYGFLETQLALALAGVDRPQVLAELLEAVVRVDQAQAH